MKRNYVRRKMGAVKRLLVMAVIAFALVGCGGVGNVDERVKAWENDRIDGYGVEVTSASCVEAKSAEPVDNPEPTYRCKLTYSNGTFANYVAYFSGGDFLGLNGPTGGTYVDPWTQYSSDIRDATAACLNDRGADVSTSFDQLALAAQDAKGGGLSGMVERSEVAIAFALTAGEAERIEADNKATAESTGQTQSVVSRRGNVVVTWLFPPTEGALSIVEACLVENG